MRVMRDENRISDKFEKVSGDFTKARRVFDHSI